METSDLYTQAIGLMVSLIRFAIVLCAVWASETIVTMLLKEPRESKKRKKEREERRPEYHDRIMANDEKHAKVTRAMRRDVQSRDDFRCVNCGRGCEDGLKAPRRPYQARLAQEKVRNEQSADALR